MGLRWPRPRPIRSSMTRRMSAVIAEAVRRSALADYRDRFAALTAASGRELSIRELPVVSQVNLRADPNNADLMHRLAAALGFPLPVVPNDVASREERRALWLGPRQGVVRGAGGPPGNPRTGG